jgi:hypothetical protein
MFTKACHWDTILTHRNRGHISSPSLFKNNPERLQCLLHRLRDRYTKSAGFYPKVDHDWLLSSVIIASPHWTRPLPTAWADRYRAVPLILLPKALGRAVDWLLLWCDERRRDVMFYRRWKDGSSSPLTDIVWKENLNTHTGKNVRLVVFPTKPATRKPANVSKFRPSGSI